MFSLIVRENESYRSNSARSRSAARNSLLRSWRHNLRSSGVGDRLRDSNLLNRGSVLDLGTSRADGDGAGSSGVGDLLDRGSVLVLGATETGHGRGRSSGGDNRLGGSGIGKLLRKRGILILN
jgi:hypothetical protein